MRFTKYRGAFLILLLFLLALTVPAFAMDAPHNGANGVGCNSCHALWNVSPGQHIDDSTMNKLCQDCHVPTGGGAATAKVNHTGKETNSDGTYYENGVQTNWTLQCINCHDPHYQKQSVVYKGDISTGGAYLVTNTIAVGGLLDEYNGLNAGSDTLIETIVSNGSPGWTPDQFKGYSLVIGDSRLRTYRIRSNTISNIVVFTSPVAGIRTGYRYAEEGTTFRIVYGKMIRAQMLAPRPIKNSTSSEIFNANLYRDTKFFQNSGEYSPAASTGDSQALCIVCHTRTKVLNIGAVMYGIDNFPEAAMGGVINDSHDTRVSDGNQVYDTCWSDTAGCHKAPDEGFDGAGLECGDCHGTASSPVYTLINAPNDEAVYPKPPDFFTTGRASVGAHQRHKDTGFLCEWCHLDGGNEGAVEPWDTHNTFDTDAMHQLTMGFKMNPSGAKYGVTPRFSALALQSSTYFAFSNSTEFDQDWVSGPDPGECSNFYCHSDGTALAGGFKTVGWDDTLGCNGCHGSGAELVTTDLHKDGGSGLHVYGEYNYLCYECHSTTVNPSNVVNIGGEQHVDEEPDVVFANISVGGSWDGGTLTCGVYCHSDGKGGANAPKWDDTPVGGSNCAECHDIGGGLTSLSTAHRDHTSGVNVAYKCQDCHELTVSGDTTVISTALHINQLQDIDILAANGGDGFDYQAGSETCATTYCHGPTSPDWSTDLSSFDLCTKCHGYRVSGGLINDSAPGARGSGFDLSFDTAADDNEVGAHQAHLEATGLISDPIACEECHPYPASVTAPGHIDDPTPAEVPVDGTLATSGEAHVINTSYTFGTRVCANVYCHDTALSGKPLITGGTNVIPVWNDTSFFQTPSNTTEAQTYCARCHGFPPTDGGHPNRLDCAACHGMVVDGDHFTFTTNRSLHIDGKVDGGGCDTCHGSPPINQATITNNPDYTGLTAGAHDIHWSNPVVNSCDLCHRGGGDASHSSSYRITMGFSNTEDNPSTLYNGGAYYGATSPAYSNSFDAETKDTAWATIEAGQNRDCDNIYCHSDGGERGGSITYASNTPNWDDSFVYPPSCNQCHNDGGAGFVDNNAHPRHVDSAQYNIGCDICHAETVNSAMFIINAAIHVDANKDVLFSGIATGGGYTSPPQCDNIYCHTDGAGNGALNTAGWAEGTYGCADCHDTGGASSVLSGAHAPHTDGLYGCVDCHVDTVTNDTTIKAAGGFAKHVDNVQDVVISGTYGGDANSYQIGTETCENTYCHGTGSPAWTDTFAYNCVACHGDPAGSVLLDSAPGIGGVGNDTSGTDNLPGDAQVGAHRVHLEATDGITEPIACNECHTIPGTVTTAGHIDNSTPAEVPTDGTLATSWNATAGGTTYSGGTCSNVYCHDGNVQKNAYGPGDESTPLWTDTGYFTLPTSLAEAQVQCAKCHGYPPPPSHPTGTNCGGCHGTVVGGDHYTIISTAQHINGAVEQSGCTGCHGTPPIDGGTVVSTYGGTGQTAGAHDAHWSNSLMGPSLGDCDLCHKGGGGGGHEDTERITMGFSSTTNNPNALYTGGYYTGTSYAGNFDIESGDGGTGFTTGGGTKDCDNIYCHSDGGTRGGGTSYATPDWDAAAFNYPAACNQCHNDTGAGFVDNNVHPAHVSASTYDIDCVVCHYDTVQASPGYGIIGNHVDAKKDVVFDGGALTSGADWDSGTGICANLFCHSSGESSPAAPTTAADWDVSPGTFGCGDCHNEGTSMITGRHEKHVNAPSSYACTECHIGTLDNDTTIGVGKFGNHVDGASTVEFSAAGNWVDPNCSSVYCHSDGGERGGSTSYVTQSWGVAEFSYPTDCDKCHNDGAGGFVDNNVHPAHVSSSGYNIDCVVCHNATVGASPTYPISGNHVNSAKDVVFDGGALTSGADWNSGTGVCANLYCHTTGESTPNPPVTAADWDVTPGTFGCGDCHESGTSMNTGKHQKHVNNGAMGREFACIDCHIGTLDSDTTIGAGKIGNHVDGTRTVLFNSLYGGNWVDPNCSSVYCHSDGNSDDSGTIHYRNLGWSATITTCGGCHGDGSTVVYPNYANAGAGPNGNSHDRHVNAQSIACSDCHSATTAGSTLIDGSAPDQHINKIIEVDMAAGSYGGSTCSSTTCHGSGSDAWGTDNTGDHVCTTCHGKRVAPGSYTAGDLDAAPGRSGTGVDTNNQAGTGDAQVGAHQAHLEAVDNIADPIACNECHDTISSVGQAGHLDVGSLDFADVPIDGALATFGGKTGDYVGSGPGSCANTHCHDRGGSDTQPTWNADLVTGEDAASCGRCHGYPPAAHAGDQVTDPCNTCHSLTMTGWFGMIINGDTKHLNGFVEADGDCITCHSATAPKSSAASWDEDNNGVREVVSEFADVQTRVVATTVDAWGSHHVFGYTLEIRHCTTCHGEGDGNGLVNSTLHNNSQIDLRDADDANAYFAFNGTQFTNVDLHCMSCHDGDGAQQTAFAPGANSAKPWGNGQVTNAYDQVDRGAVWDVKTQFDPSNESHHAVRAQKYTAPLLFNAGLLINTTIAGNTVTDSVMLHCGDCHSYGKKVDDPTYGWQRVGAHGTVNEYMLRTLDNVPTNGADVMHPINGVVCINCHSGDMYLGYGHGPDSQQDKQHSAGQTGLAARTTGFGKGGPANGMNCSGCHNSGATEWAGTHGGSGTYTDHNGNTQGVYRFMPGYSNDTYAPANSSWTGTTRGTCYTTNAGTGVWTDCSQHDAMSAGANSSNVDRPINY